MSGSSLWGLRVTARSGIKASTGGRLHPQQRVGVGGRVSAGVSLAQRWGPVPVAPVLIFRLLPCLMASLAARHRFRSRL